MNMVLLDVLCSIARKLSNVTQKFGTHYDAMSMSISSSVQVSSNLIYNLVKSLAEILARSLNLVGDQANLISKFRVKPSKFLLKPVKTILTHLLQSFTVH